MANAALCFSSAVSRELCHGPAPSHPFAQTGGPTSDDLRACLLCFLLAASLWRVRLHALAPLGWCAGPLHTQAPAPLCAAFFLRSVRGRTLSPSLSLYCSFAFAFI